MRVPGGYGWGHELPAGTQFTDASFIIELLGDAPITIDDVALVNPDGLEMLGAMIIPPVRPYPGTIVLNTWPPNEDDMLADDGFDFSGMEDAIGATLDPADDTTGQGWELFVGMVAPERGEWRRDGLKITYHTEQGTSYCPSIPAEVVFTAS